MQSHPTSVKERKMKAGPSKLGEVGSISYSMQAPVSYSQLLMGAAESHAFTQQQMSPNFIPLDPTNAMLYGPEDSAQSSSSFLLIFQFQPDKKRSHRKMKNPKVFFDILIGKANSGRVVMELFADTTPETAEYFHLFLFSMMFKYGLFPDHVVLFNTWK
ncbi:peptidyl-prolyl cis-trans isomerase CYP19-3 [Olea europaea subsp. europaea]|uniref:Peptidyl-prolyl cis-trans isomerase CYP19-3 n=1 Tax=Olea europaea subsp. europaea TaxID=158383 RepID=A0A8S0U2H0_OLEEU|nr:peptidyl-prolyl cis-trans isomerase CYP19-3 [Olea europaea subsp. europaea]